MSFYITSVNEPERNQPSTTTPPPTAKLCMKRTLRPSKRFLPPIHPLKAPTRNPLEPHLPLTHHSPTMPPRNRRSGGPLPREVTVSKAMSFILRHGAEKEGIKLDAQGYANVADLVSPSPPPPPILLSPTVPLSPAAHANRLSPAPHS